MALPAAAVILPLGLLFFFSGLVVNIIQATCFVLIRPLSKNTYRKINRRVAELMWIELVWIVDWWARVQIKIFTDPETFRLLGMCKRFLATVIVVIYISFVICHSPSQVSQVLYHVISKHVITFWECCCMAVSISHISDFRLLI